MDKGQTLLILLLSFSSNPENKQQVVFIKEWIEIVV